MSFVRAGFPFNYDADMASLESGLECKDDSLALQSQAEDADINTIVRRFGLTGQVPQSLRLPTFQDFDEIFDYRTALEQVMAAQESFLKVPADIRARFGNDPQQFVEFCSDPANLPELRRMKLAPEAVDPLVELVKEVEREEAKDKIRAKRGSAPVGAPVPESSDAGKAR